MIDLRSQKGVQLGALIESITIFASPSKMTDGSWRLAAKETARRATLALAQAGEETDSLAVEIICPLESRQIAEGKEALRVMAASKLNLTQLGGGGTLADVVGCIFNFQALEWAKKLLLISAAMSIGKLGGELSKTSLLLLHQIRSHVIAAKRVKVWVS